jgi:hypothetical protein
LLLKSGGSDEGRTSAMSFRTKSQERGTESGMTDCKEVDASWKFEITYLTLNVEQNTASDSYVAFIRRPGQAGPCASLCAMWKIRLCI